ncbi:MAG: hypothetical protein QXD66_06050 [Candidatus Nezhaarchaeales archaeon]
MSRSHYSISKPTVKACNLIFQISLELAKDLDCPIHLLYLEEKRSTIKDVLERVRKVG